MRPKHLLALLLAAIPLACFPQIEANDPVSFRQNKRDGISMEENVKPDDIFILRRGGVEIGMCDSRRW